MLLKDLRMPKTFVLDTNVLLHSAGSVESFQENNVVIPMAVIEELDKFKKYQDELGRNARQVIRLLDHLRENGKLSKGVSLKKVSKIASGKLFVLTAASLDSELATAMRDVFNSDLGADSPDNRILRVAFTLSKMNKNVVFISKDINLRLKADALGIKVMDFEREKIDYNALYNGYRNIEISGDFIEKFIADKVVDGIQFELYPNEFVFFQDPENSKNNAIGRFHNDNLIHLLEVGKNDKMWNIFARNKEQRMAFDILLDPNIKLVTLVGGAGTGKTLLAIAGALECALHNNLYEKILVSRPIIPLGNDLGFLPGDKDAKLSHWMQPIFDNMNYLLRNGNEKVKHRSSAASLSVDQLLNSKKIELEALTYIRGRSIPKQFVVIDEAQNLTPHEVKTIISRAGEDTKMVLTGDPQQIDNPYLDASSNGLTYTAERMKGTPLHAHISLQKSERSELSALAAQLL